MKLLMALSMAAILVGGVGTIVSSVGAASTMDRAPSCAATTTTAVVTEPVRVDVPWSTPPTRVWQSTHDVRSIAARNDELWVATGGGVERYRRRADASFDRALFGVREGLDTLDTRLVRFEGESVVVETGTSRCVLAMENLTCTPRTARAPELPSKETFEGHAVTGRADVWGGTATATKGGGVFFAAPGTRVVKSLSPATRAPESFVHASAVFGGGLWLGTFRDGLVRVALEKGELPTDLDRAAESVVTPFRMVNRLAVVDGIMFVAANEGLFATRDGHHFELVPAIGARGITGVAADERDLYVTSTGAMYRLAKDARGKVRSAHLAPAGSKSVQGVVADGRGGAWLATEDRGLVRFDGKTFQAMDRLSGLPTSWLVSASSDGAGGAYAATLRHGFVHVKADGGWSRVDHGAGVWGLEISRSGTRTCSAAQEGAACSIDDRVERLAQLPDPRVHHVTTVGRALLVATEAGIAVY